MNISDFGMGIVPIAPHKNVLNFHIPSNPLDERLITYHLVQAAELLWPLHDAGALKSGEYSKEIISITNKLHINLCRSFFPDHKAYAVTRKWLENDPRTTTDAYAMELRHSIDKEYVQYNLKIWIFLTEDDKQALRDAGLLKPDYITYSTETLSCNT